MLDLYIYIYIHIKYTCKCVYEKSPHENFREGCDTRKSGCCSVIPADIKLAFQVLHREQLLGACK